MEFDQLWQNALSEIELQISRPNYVTWLKNSHLIDKQDGIALVSLPNNFAKEWVENKYYKVILSVLRNLDESTKKIEFTVTNKQGSADNLKKKISNTVSKSQLAFEELKIDPETNLNPRYNLSSFVVGKSNELAFAAASAVIDEIGRKYNPFFIYGGVGLGKTHLIQGIGNEIKKKYDNNVRVKYVSSEKFTNDVIYGIRNKRMEDMKEKYRNVDVLIIDDIQFIGGKTSTEEEFFHTFNALYENNKQIIISSDRPPKFIPTLQERLSSRFEGGMLADIGYPDYELRLAILRTKIQDRGADLPENIVEFVANKVQKNLRELEGVLNRIIFYQQAKSGISLRAVEEIVNETIQQPTKNINPNQVIKAVADYFQISPNDLTGRCRQKSVVEPRQVTMYLLRDILGLSYPDIGLKLGKRDHTTAIYAYSKLSGEINKNQDLNQKVIAIKDIIYKE
ncbi:MAG: chromosomal replication initiator protein DnaA [Candidatus Harrisonbacteria bacterium]|nr:chromosomal replication initiator protein DnaA [Candidatus Harrisonbacteria bacterium]